MSETLPDRAHLGWYRKAAKKHLKHLRTGNPSALLADAQRAVAREHGFTSWRTLLAAVAAKASQSPANVSQVFGDAAKAIVRRNIETARSIIQNVPEVIHYNGPHPNWAGRPQLLHLAIEVGDEAIARALLDAGADASGNNGAYDGWSPLMLSIHWKRDALRDLLIESGAAIGLYEALMLGDDNRALPLIDRLDPTLAAPNNATPLHFAGSPAAAERLIGRGIDIAAKDKYGRTALDAAARGGNAQVAAILQKRGAIASPDAFARLGDLTSLQGALGNNRPSVELLKSAIEGDQIKVVRWLLSTGIDVNEPDEKGISPLHTAAWEGNLPIVKLLVKSGANVHAEDDQYSATPTGWAQHAAQNFNRFACVDVAGYLQKQEEATWSAKTLPAHRQTHKVARWKPIMDAAFDGDSTRIEKLLKDGADPNAISTTPGAHRPLHRAIEEKKTSPRGPQHEAAVKTLLAGGADPQARGGNDRLTALQLAALDSPRFVPLLIDAFQPLDLFHACALLDRPRIESLLKKDRSLATKTDANGFTPLHYVAGSRMCRLSESLAADQLRIARLLIDSGAGVNAIYAWPGPGNWPIPVLYMCCGRNDNAALTELLMQAGAEPYDNESVYHASDEGHDACLAIIEKYSDATMLADECTKCLRTQMHWGRSRGTKWLLEHGADPNSLHPQFGNSALHAAALHGANEKVIALLLTHGADPTVKSAAGETAIDIARKAKKEHVVKQLTASSSDDRVMGTIKLDSCRG